MYWVVTERHAWEKLQEVTGRRKSRFGTGSKLVPFIILLEVSSVGVPQNYDCGILLSRKAKMEGGVQALLTGPGECPSLFLG